jgi:hypothetical protein
MARTDGAKVKHAKNRKDAEMKAGHKCEHQVGEFTSSGRDRHSLHYRSVREEFDTGVNRKHSIETRDLQYSV